MTRSPYGKKGGTSVNAGRKAATYEVTFPDGTKARKRSFAVDTPTAWVGCYFSERESRWYSAGVALGTWDDNGTLRPFYSYLPSGKPYCVAAGQIAIEAPRVGK